MSDDGEKCSSAVVVVTEPPFCVREADDEWCEKTGFMRTQIVGRTMRMLQGPETNMTKLKTLIQSVKEGKGGESALLTLYMSSGDDFLCHIMAQPHTTSAGELCCKLDTRFSDATTLKIAQTEDGIGKVIISPKAPFTVQFASKKFCDMFSFLEQQVDSRSLMMIFGPKTDNKMWIEIVDKVTSFGIAQDKDPLVFCDSACAELLCHVRVVPILSEDKTHIDRLMVNFAKAGKPFIKSCVSSAKSSFDGSDMMGSAASFDQVALDKITSQKGGSWKSPDMSPNSSIAQTAVVEVAEEKKEHEMVRSSPEMEHPDLPPPPEADQFKKPGAGEEVSSRAPSGGLCAVPNSRTVGTIDRATMRHLLAMRKRTRSIDGCSHLHQMAKQDTAKNSFIDGKDFNFPVVSLANGLTVEMIDSVGNFPHPFMSIRIFVRV